MLDPDSNTDPNIAYTTKADIWSLGKFNLVYEKG